MLSGDHFIQHTLLNGVQHGIAKACEGQSENSYNYMPKNKRAYRYCNNNPRYYCRVIPTFCIYFLTEQCSNAADHTEDKHKHADPEFIVAHILEVLLTVKEQNGLCCKRTNHEHHPLCHVFLLNTT